MIKINLLPPNIYEARNKIRAMIGCGVLVVAVAGGMFYWHTSLQNQITTVKAQADTAQRLSEQVDQLKTEAANTRAPITDEILPKITFFKAVATYNNAYPDLYENVAKFTKRDVVYSKISPTGGTTLTIDATATSLMNVGLYLRNMYRATNIFTNVSITTSVGGYAYGGASIAGAGSTPGSYPISMPGGMSPGMPIPVPTSMPGLPGATSYGGLGAIGTGVSRAANSKNLINFSVTCTLKTAITPPVPPGGAAAAGAGAGAPGMPPMPTAAPAPPTPPSAGGGQSDSGSRRGGADV